MRLVFAVTILCSFVLPASRGGDLGEDEVSMLQTTEKDIRRREVRRPLNQSKFPGMTYRAYRASMVSVHMSMSERRGCDEACQEILDTEGLVADALFAFFLGLAGDVICQTVIEKRQFPKHGAWRWRWRGEPSHDTSIVDPRRLLAICVFQAIYTALLHFVFQAYPVLIQYTVTHVFLPNSLAAMLSEEQSTLHALACALMDNVFDCLVSIPGFFLGVGLLQGDDMQETIENLKVEWLSTYLVCTTFWVPLTWAIFAFIDEEHRVQVFAVCNVIWNLIIDYMAHRSLPLSHLK